MEQIKTFSDPYRIKILNYFIDFNRPATVKQIADAMNEVPSKVHYHIKKMQKSNILTLVYTEEINGIVAKFYEPTAKTFTLDDTIFIPQYTHVLKSHLEQILHENYLKSEEIVLKNMDNCIDSPKSKYPISISHDYIYLTGKEETEFRNYLLDFISKHSKKTDDSTLNKYYFFNSFSRIKDE